jgi:hypothetical protein
MKPIFAQVGVLAFLATAAGCAVKPLQQPDAGGGGIGSIDAGKDAPPTTGRDAADDPPVAVDLVIGTDLPPEAAIDAPPPFTGVRSFVVTSQLQRDGGVGTFPTAHVFTLVLDADRRTAIAGDAGEGTATAFEVLASGALHILGALRFTTGGCAGSSVSYDDMQFTIEADGSLTGAGRGQLVTVSGDVAYSAAATMSLSGGPDTQAPTLALTGGATDPFVTFAIVASEPLPPDVTASLNAANGELYMLAPSGTTGTFITGFQKPAIMLRYATQYFITTGGITDFARNAPIAGNNLTFTTRALPPLAAEDGFESVTDATFGGVQVLSGAGAPTLSGARSLYIPPTSGVPTTTTQPQFLVRLMLTQGDTVVRFAYRTVTAGTTSTSFPYGATWLLGSEGGMIASPSLPPDAGATTPATIGGAQVTLGPLMTATFTLPPDAHSEVALQRTAQSYAGCGGPMPPISGLIIDDLRAE